MLEIGMKNVVNNASWSITDILISTPYIMQHILEKKEQYDPYDINPATIIIDEFDELLSNENSSKYLFKILRKFGTF